jgi:hypothetical protein
MSNGWGIFVLSPTEVVKTGWSTDLELNQKWLAYTLKVWGLNSLPLIPSGTVPAR